MTGKLTFVLAQSALELVPQSIASHTACRNHAKKVNKRPTHTILDGSIHHSAMRKLQDKDMRGRPDIVHFCLLEALGSPLNREGLLDVWVHTCDDRAIHFDPALKLPRSQDRFKGVMEKLMVEGSLENKLMTIEDEVEYTALAGRLDVDAVVGLVEENGRPFDEVTKELSSDGRGPGDMNVALVAGGFAHGELHPEVRRSFSHRVSIYRQPLDTWTAVSRALAHWEKALGI